MNRSHDPVFAVLLLLVAGVYMIWTGLDALREPESAPFWTDSVGLWLAQRLRGKVAAEEVEQHIHDKARIERSGKGSIYIGTVFVLAAITLVVLHALGIP